MSSFIADDESPGSASSSSTVIAINRDKNSQFAVKWAVENLFNKKSNGQCILIHVRCQSLHPHDMETAHRESHPPTEAELHQFFLPYRGFCARKGILAKEIIIHDIDVPSALIDFIGNHSISNIVVGASSRNAIVRKFKNPDVPTSLLKSTPESCSVYVIGRGRVQSKKLGNRHNSHTDGLYSPTGASTVERSISTVKQPLYHEFSLSEDRIRKLHVDVYNSSLSHDSARQSVDSSVSGKSTYLSSLSGISDFSGPFSFKSMGTSSEIMDFSFTSDSGSKSSTSSQTPSALEAEMRKLRFELKQTMEMYDSACKEAVEAKRKARELQHLKLQKEKKLEQVKSGEEAAIALIEVEKQKTKAATEAALMAQRLAELETQKRQYAELKARNRSDEKSKTVHMFEQNNICYRRYTIEEIEVATDYFNESNKIGEGGYGPVYKGLLEYTTVAVKILRPDRSHGQRQFQQEIEVLSCMRHPHMVLLLGACPEYGCLVYEYMENGSLDDRLFQRENTPPIPWRTRFKIASDIATALLFLHQMKPEPLVHRDLKPANILLDQNYVSKIGDVGLARLVPPSVADNVTQYHMTAAAGTFCYIDPEYQQTGMLGVRSDIYSFGVLLLQLITAKPPMGLSYQVEEAIEHGTFSAMLDPTVSDWPVEDALVLAKLALKCCELRKRDRPDLRTVILPELIRLRNIGLSNNRPLNVNSHSHRTYNSVPHFQHPPEHEINVRKRWQQMKISTRSWNPKIIAVIANSQQAKKFWSFKNGSAKARFSQPSEGQDGDVDEEPKTERCWSFVSCTSAATLGLKKFDSLP